MIRVSHAKGVGGSRQKNGGQKTQKTDESTCCEIDMLNLLMSQSLTGVGIPSGVGKPPGIPCTRGTQISGLPVLQRSAARGREPGFERASCQASEAQRGVYRGERRRFNTLTAVSFNVDRRTSFLARNSAMVLAANAVPDAGRSCYVGKVIKFILIFDFRR